MTALEKLAFQLNPTDPHVADEFFDTFRWKCPDDVFSDVRTCDSCDTFHTCIQCWLQEVNE